MDSSIQSARQYSVPSNGLGALHLALESGLLAGGVAASISGHPVAWVCGQLMLALGFTHAFVALHEAGHRTLFRTRWLNVAAGWFVGLVALIPYATWRPVHAAHHRCTGWQDLDATTAALVPRRLSAVERVITNVAWRCWVPIFSVIYRIQNYWNLLRLRHFRATPRPVWHYLPALLLQLLVYAALGIWCGWSQLWLAVGPGLVLSLMAQDLLLLSQHTGMPTHLSGDRKVKMFPPREQGAFTRSLRLPDWLSWFLLHVDAHELHHLHPTVPGHSLRQLTDAAPNEVPWLEWVRSVKKLRGTQFLFGEPRGQQQT